MLKINKKEIRPMPTKYLHVVVAKMKEKVGQYSTRNESKKMIKNCFYF